MLKKFSGFKSINFILTFLILVLIIYFLGPMKIFNALIKTNPFYLFLALLFYIANITIISLRLNFILKHLGEKLTALNTFFVNLAGLLASDFTPARSGYFAVPLLLDKLYKIPAEQGLISIISPQIIDFFIKAVGVCVFVFILAYNIPAISDNLLLFLFGSFSMLAFSIILALVAFVPNFLNLFRPLSFLPFAKKGFDFISSMHKSRAKVASIFPILILISLFTFLLKGAEWYFFGQALGVEFNSTINPYLIFLFLQPILTAVQFVPFPTLAGFGVSEATAVFCMGLLGIPLELAAAYMFLVRAMTVLVDSLGISVLLKMK